MTDYFRLSCEIFGWLTISKSHALEIIYLVVVRWRENWQLGRWMNQSWGAQLQNHQINIFPLWSVAVVSEEKKEDTWVLPWHCYFLWFKNLCYELMGQKDRELLTNHIVLYTRLTLVVTYQNILENILHKNYVLIIGLTDQLYYSICHFIIRLFTHTVYTSFAKFQITKVQTLNFTNLRFEQNCLYIAGVDIYLL